MYKLESFLAPTIYLALAVAVGPDTLAQDMQWPVRYGDTFNSSSTSAALSGQLKERWRSPGDGPPLVYTHGSRKLAISGSFAYDAWTGELRHYFPSASGLWAAIGYEIDAPAGAGTIRTDVYVTFCEVDGMLHAYDLRSANFDELWTLQPTWINARCFINVLNGVAYLSGSYEWGYGNSEWVGAAVDLGTGAKLWENHESHYGTQAVQPDSPPAVANISLDPASPDSSDRADVMLLNAGALGWPTLMAIDCLSGELHWINENLDLRGVACDPDLGLIYGTTVWPNLFTAVNAASGAVVWQTDVSFPADGPPAFGVALNSSNSLRPAAFVATFGEHLGSTGPVYAIDRETGETLWSTDIGQTYSNASYAGGEVLVPVFPTVSSPTEVLHAATGEWQAVLPTDGTSAWAYESARVVVSVDHDDEEVSPPESVLYFFSSGGEIVAWNRLGTNPTPRILRLTMPEPFEMDLQDRGPITVTLLLDGDIPIEDATVTFSSDAGNNQGFLEETVAVTNAQGNATVWFRSDKRECNVVIMAETAGASPATTVVTVRRGGSTDPPPTETGTVTGTVHFAETQKPARKATVELLTTSGQVAANVTTNPKGKYTIEEVPVGTYVVRATLNGASRVSDAFTVGVNQTVEVNIGLVPAN